MASSNGQLQATQFCSGAVLPATSFDLHDIGTIKVYAILEHEMISLNSLAGRESAAIGFFWGCFGAFVSAGLALLVSPPTGVALAVYAAVTAVLGLGSCAFAVQWYFASKERNAMVGSIRDRSSSPVTLQLSPSSLPAGTPAQ